jgi:hypothetical protein
MPPFLKFKTPRLIGGERTFISFRPEGRFFLAIVGVFPRQKDKDGKTKNAG